MWSIVSAAGWPIWPLIFASVVAVAIVIERVVALNANKLFPADLVNDVVRTLPQFRDVQNIQRLQQHSPLGSILASGLLAWREGKPAEEPMQTRLGQVQHHMDKHLDVLSLIASASPLMGLLGTVVGMIEIFAVQGATSQTPEALAAGIAVALYNTAFGLIVAIPALVAYRLLRIRINNLLNALEDMLLPFEQALDNTRPAPAQRKAS
ncbi:MAG TPA: MotA/TolQ/ExbB proton channel family protein [Limnobacter sp.]|uniref:MotA/TolQ/ExbB proton channel family protein n=1 Tax=Limnobacter sp. TaxID=2003368 RepID=UPI002ED8338F